MTKEIPFTFDTFGFSEPLIRAIREAGFRQPSPIQSQVIPLILQGRDLVAQAHTGTGKTAAFCLPAMQNMKNNRGVELLVIAPTRELAAQVSDEIYRLGHHAGVRSTAITGGQSYDRQFYPPCLYSSCPTTSLRTAKPVLEAHVGTSFVLVFVGLNMPEQVLVYQRIVSPRQRETTDQPCSQGQLLHR